jgi:hypothetical protein
VTRAKLERERGVARRTRGKRIECGHAQQDGGDNGDQNEGETGGRAHGASLEAGRSG